MPSSHGRDLGEHSCVRRTGSHVLARGLKNRAESAQSAVDRQTWKTAPGRDQAISAPPSRGCCLSVASLVIRARRAER